MCHSWCYWKGRYLYISKLYILLAFSRNFVRVHSIIVMFLCYSKYTLQRNKYYNDSKKRRWTVWKMFTKPKSHITYKRNTTLNDPLTIRVDDFPEIYLDALQTLANAADAVESGGKSPVSALNELGVKVHYTVLRQGGPAHCPSFTVAVTVSVWWETGIATRTPYTSLSLHSIQRNRFRWLFVSRNSYVVSIN